MYNTPVGVRVLEGAERRLFVETLAMLVDDVSMEDEPLDSGPYYGLQRNQKIFVLHTVARAVLWPDEAAPRLTAADRSSCRGRVRTRWLDGERQPSTCCNCTAPRYNPSICRPCTISRAKMARNDPL